MHCREAHAAIVVYDITDKYGSSFEKAKFWVKKLQEVASPDIFIALVGNQADFASQRMVSYEVVYMFCSCGFNILHKICRAGDLKNTAQLAKYL